MNDGVEGHAIFPRVGKVLDADAGVLGSRALGPAEQCFAGRQGLVLSHHNIRNLDKKERKEIRARILRMHNSNIIKSQLNNFKTLFEMAFLF